MTTKPRKEAVELADKILTAMGDEFRRLGARGKHAQRQIDELAKRIEDEAIRPVADPLAGELEWYEERARQLADPKRPDSYKEAVFKELELDGGQRARAALADYREDGK